MRPAERLLNRATYEDSLKTVKTEWFRWHGRCWEGSDVVDKYKVCGFKTGIWSHERASWIHLVGYGTVLSTRTVQSGAAEKGLNWNEVFFLFRSQAHFFSWLFTMWLKEVVGCIDCGLCSSHDIHVFFVAQNSLVQRWDGPWTVCLCLTSLGADFVDLHLAVDGLFLNESKSEFFI